MSKWIKDCAGGCGKRMKLNSTNAAVPICRKCRYQRSLLNCLWCKHSFRPRSGSTTANYCSRHCFMLGRWFDKRNPLPPKRADLRDIILP